MFYCFNLNGRQSHKPMIALAWQWAPRKRFRNSEIASPARGQIRTHLVIERVLDCKQTLSVGTTPGDEF